jgi:TRAP-type C4-dicarboxylate transport system substrate-binding protein
MKGMKIRVSGGITDEIAAALGSVPFFAPASESYEVISKGVADGIYFPMESVYNFKIAPAIKYALKIPGGLYRSSHYLIMNQAKWDSLSNADKAAIESVSGEKLAELAAAMWDAQDKLGQEAMLKGGTVISTASGPLLKDITAKLSRLEAGWISKAKGRGVDGAAALAFFKKEIAAVK